MLYRESLVSMNKNLLVYNRVPKTGSSRLMDILKTISRKGLFSFDGGRVFPKLSSNEQHEFVLNSTNMAKNGKLVITPHMYFIDYNLYGEMNPIYFNSIRDPMERYHLLF